MNKGERMAVHASLTVLGGLGYNAIELLWRGRTHWSMFLVGGVCFEMIGAIHRRLSHRPLAMRCGLCAAAVTGVEFISGCVVNLWLRMDVWDYSGMKWNCKGQICLLYSLFWLLLSGMAAPLYRGCYRLVCRGIGGAPGLLKKVGK